MSGWVAFRRLTAAATALTALTGLLAGCSSGGNGVADTNFSGQVFSNGSSRASLPLAGAAVTVSAYATGESLATATTDSNGHFAVSVRTLPAGTVLQITATANNNGLVTIKSYVGFPHQGQIVTVDPATTLAAVGVERLVAGGVAKAGVTSDVTGQALAAIHAAIAGGSINTDNVDFRDSAAVNAAATTALGGVVLVTSNTTVKVLVDGVQTNKGAPYLATGLTAGSHLFRAETSTQFVESSVNVTGGAGTWVHLSVAAGGGQVPSGSAHYGGDMPFHVNDETMSSPVSAVSVQAAPGFPDKRLVTIQLQGVNGVPLQRAIIISGTADVVASDKISGTAGSASNSTIRADFLSGTNTVTQFSETVQSSIFTLTFNSDGSVSFTVQANGTLLSGNASGTLPGLGP